VPFEHLNRSFIDLKKSHFQLLKKQKMTSKWHSTTWIIAFSTSFKSLSPRFAPPSGGRAQDLAGSPHSEYALDRLEGQTPDPQTHVEYVRMWPFNQTG